ncbi:hypothetical protein K7432_008231 [Basidiobolus ranarum]|uniref:Promethin n=1 Tax=Basidiobolus ranarum TaxID=34480 RepID=A0ABR2WS49_9FUNG
MNTQTEPSSNDLTPTPHNSNRKKPNKKRGQTTQQDTSVGAVIDRILEDGQLTSRLQTSLYEQMSSANEYLNEHASLQVLVYGTFILGLLPTIMFGVYVFSTFAGVFGAVFLSFCAIEGIMLTFGLIVLVPVLLTCFGTMLFLISTYYFLRYAYQVSCRVQYWLENSINPPTYHPTALYSTEKRNHALQPAEEESEDTDQVLPQD